MIVCYEASTDKKIAILKNYLYNEQLQAERQRQIIFIVTSAEQPAGKVTVLQIKGDY